MYGTDQISRQSTLTVVIKITTAASPFSHIQPLSVSAGSSVSATGVCVATADKDVAHEVSWHVAINGRIF